MKTWIIILSVLVVVLYLLSKGLANYIRNDSDAKLEYVLYKGLSKLGIAYSIVVLLCELAFLVDVILLLIYFL